MTKAKEILAKYPSVKLGLDEHYGKQTVLNALNEALRIHDVVGRSEQLKAFAEMVVKDDFAYLKDAETLLKDFESL